MGRLHAKQDPLSKHRCQDRTSSQCAPGCRPTRICKCGSTCAAAAWIVVDQLLLLSGRECQHFARPGQVYFDEWSHKLATSHETQQVHRQVDRARRWGTGRRIYREGRDMLDRLLLIVSMANRGRCPASISICGVARRLREIGRGRGRMHIHPWCGDRAWVRFRMQSTE